MAPPKLLVAVVDVGASAMPLEEKLHQKWGENGTSGVFRGSFHPTPTAIDRDRLSPVPSFLPSLLNCIYDRRGHIVRVRVRKNKSIVEVTVCGYHTFLWVCLCFVRRCDRYT